MIIINSRNICQPDIIENEGCRMAIFYKPAKGLIKPSREIEEINYTFSNPTNKGVKFIDFILTDNTLELTQSSNPIFQGDASGLPESQLKLEIMEGIVDYHYYNNDGNSNIHRANTEVLEHNYHRYEGYDDNLGMDIAHAGMISDITKSVENHLLSEEVQVMLNSVLEHIKSMTNHDLDTIYEYGILAHFKEMLEELDLKMTNSQKKYVR